MKRHLQGIHGGRIVSVRLLLIKSEANVCRGRKTNFLSTLLGLSLDIPIINDRLMGEKTNKSLISISYTHERDQETMALATTLNTITKDKRSFGVRGGQMWKLIDFLEI